MRRKQREALNHHTCILSLYDAQNEQQSDECLHGLGHDHLRDVSENVLMLRSFQRSSVDVKQ
jgi:hypothetical protein